MRHEARGIVAEPPKRLSAKHERREGDGADSPTRARSAPLVRPREAARPTNFASQNPMKNEKWAVGSRLEVEKDFLWLGEKKILLL